MLRVSTREREAEDVALQLASYDEFHFSLACNLSDDQTSDDRLLF